MPLMRPPHYNGVRYNGAEVPAGSMVSVLDRDTESHLRDGWALVGDVTADPPTVLSVEEDD